MKDGSRRLQELSWPLSQLGQALVALAEQSGLQQKAGEPGRSPVSRPSAVAAPPSGLSPEALERRLRTTAGRMGLEVEPVSSTYSRLEHLLRDGEPAILRLPDAAGDRYLLLMGSQGNDILLLDRDRDQHRLPLETVRAALAGRLEEQVAPDVAEMLETVGIPHRRRQRARRALLNQHLGSTPVAAGWLLRLSPGSDAWAQARQAGLLRHLITFLGAYSVQHVLFLLSWWVVGRGALQQRLATGWLWAWLLILLTIIPFRLLFTRAQGLLALHAGALLKQRLLAGVLRLEPDEVRHQGVGQLLGRVIESEAIESLALRGGFLGLVAVVELLFAAFVLSLGAGGVLHVLLLLAWLSITGLLARRYYRQRARWTEARLEMTHDLVEQMVGHRTRLVQERPQERHRAEDEALKRYLRRSQEMDASTVLLSALLPRGWLLLGLLGLVPAFVTGVPRVAALAVGLGGVLLALRALNKLSRGLTDLAGAVIAWHRIAGLYEAAARRIESGEPDATSQFADADTSPLIEGESLTYSYADQPSPALQRCRFRVDRSARVLLQGPSGGGKSTLVALLAGLRQPESGSLRLYGLDRETLGADVWRRHVAAAPQFDENYVLTSTLSFNLLLGRRWPADPEVLQEAEALCHELGLGPLLATMPAGLQQVVGESGWQLSHGERSRLYLARALLQDAQLIVLDESFAALDPENLRDALKVVRRRAPALVVIAHP